MEAGLNDSRSVGIAVRHSPTKKAHQEPAPSLDAGLSDQASY